MALGNVRPADALLTRNVAENDLLNGSATVLRELLKLKQASRRLTAAQDAAFEELLAGPGLA